MFSFSFNQRKRDFSDFNIKKTLIFNWKTTKLLQKTKLIKTEPIHVEIKKENLEENEILEFQKSIKNTNSYKFLQKKNISNFNEIKLYFKRKKDSPPFLYLKKNIFDTNINKYINKLKQLLHINKLSRQKYYFVELSKELKTIFKYNNLISIKKNQLSVSTLSIFLNVEAIQKYIINILKRHNSLKYYDQIKYFLMFLFLSFEELREKSNYYLKLNNFIVNGEIIVYRVFFIEKEKYSNYINSKNNSYNICTEFLITNLNFNETFYINNLKNKFDFNTIVLKIRIKTERKYNDYLYLSNNFKNDNFDNQILIRSGSILKIYEIKEKKLENGQIITYMISKLLSKGGFESVFQALIDDNKKEKHYENILSLKDQKNRTLDLSKNKYLINYCSQNLDDFCDVIKLSQNLQILNLSKNNIGPNSIINPKLIRDLSEAIKVSQYLSILYLNENELGPASVENPDIMKNLSEAIKLNKHLKEIYLSYNKLGSASLKNPHIVSDLTEAIKINHNLEGFGLSGNEFGPSSISNKNLMKDLCEAIIENKNLKRIELSDNEFGFSYWKYLLEFKNFDFLSKLSEQMSELSDAIKRNQNLEYLDLSKNNFGDASIKNPHILKNLMEAFKINKNLKIINLSKNELCDENIQRSIFKCDSSIKELFENTILKSKNAKISIKN